MKVYELMEELAAAPAGAEVCVTGWFSDEELVSKIDATQITDEGVALKHLSLDVSDTEDCDANFIIYIE